MHRVMRRGLWIVLVVNTIQLPATAMELADIGSKIDRTMATFDPIGKHIREPIERAIPNLRVKGSLRQWTDILIAPRDRVGFRQQDFRFLQLQNLLEIKPTYH